MSSTLLRDQVCSLAKTDTAKALEKARQIEEPWFRAQALAHVARYADDPVPLAARAAKAAAECEDDYKRSAVRAWEIVALAERGFNAQAGKSLKQAVSLAKTARPFSSMAEAMTLLVHAALHISRDDGEAVVKELETSCPVDEHWRCKRAVRNSKALLTGDYPLKQFFF